MAGNVPDPATVNRHTYVGNNPVNFVDPSGLSEIRIPGTKFKIDVGKAATALGVGFITNALVTSTGGAAVIGITGTIGTPGTVAWVAAGRVAGRGRKGGGNRRLDGGVRGLGTGCSIRWSRFRLSPR